MADFKLLNYAGIAGEPRPGILVGENQIVDLQQGTGGAAWAQTNIKGLNNWDTFCAALHAIAVNFGATRPLADVQLMAPLLFPPAIYCAGANYKKHAMEMLADKKTSPGKSVTIPYFLLKNEPHCVIGPDDEIKLPVLSNMVDWEAEFAVAIGKLDKNISVKTAFEHVAGYTIMDDLSAPDQGKRDDVPRFGGDWFGHKNFDTSAPIGP